MIVDEEAAVTELMSAEIENVEEEEPSIIEQPANHKMKIVIAEDDDEIRDYLDSELSKDYDVSVCVNGHEALAEVFHIKPDLVLSDVMMPEVDGNTLCSKIKSNPSTNHIPVILLTAKNRDEDKLEGLETGADAYIVKPFNMDILRRTIINLLNSRHLLRLKYGRNDNLEEQVDEIKMKSPDEKLLERVMTAINAHLDDSDLSVDMVAEQVGISRVHLHRKMKELTGQTPHDFIRNLRLKQAANLLANQGMNVTEVMYACGFSNSASFSTVFKKFYGMSPRDYMKEHQQRK
jgi:DNA-binding response OmpR family regulator